MKPTKQSNIPLKNLGVIMDGNRRWAKAHHKPKFYGHAQGVEKIHQLADWCLAAQIPEVTLYTFSLDNWKREKKEVEYLFSLVSDFFARYLDEMIAKGIALNWVGIPDGLPAKVVEILQICKKKSKRGKKLVINFVFNYSGHEDLVTAAHKIAQKVSKKELKLKAIDSKVLEQNLLSASVSPIDLLIRTSGEQRLSDFMPMQLGYSELYFCDIMWPDFSEQELKKALQAYAKRQRRFGGE